MKKKGRKKKAVRKPARTRLVAKKRAPKKRKRVHRSLMKASAGPSLSRVAQRKKRRPVKMGGPVRTRAVVPCPKCGHDLGLQTDCRCSDCGEQFTVADLVGGMER